MKKLYDLPHKFYVTQDEEGYVLWCNGKFVYFDQNIDRVFIVFGGHLATVKG